MKLTIKLPLASFTTLLLSSSMAVAAPWGLQQCDPAGTPGWQHFASDMRIAKPGSTIYVPVPFPNRVTDIARDFVAQYTAIVRGIPGTNRQPHEDRLFAAVVSGNINYQVQRVENWTITRCLPDQKRDYYNLLRIYEADGAEIGRAVINDSGLLTTWNAMPAGVPGPVPQFSRSLPSTASAMAQLNSALGILGGEPEYVAASGTIDCPLTHPCLAFRRGNLSYVVYSDSQIYEVSAAGPRFTAGKEVASSQEDATIASLSSDEKLISLGGKHFTVARLVNASMIRNQRSAFSH